MSDCGCDSARDALEEFIRNELDDVQIGEIRAHLEICPDCSDEQRVAERLREAVQRACREPAPPSLREVILENLREKHTPA
ncbi:zf-HC2 domain-containing protein [Leucobacter sp. M11]|uniref:zf-HC2 domain-containing protein n=1 Tax=Leucobacter sp. M11 TaxID=2993565 RepID=UPI002D7E3117|nr:zf-HC2 domain-containing protein [Leucobacter sp. M11]MEB4615543.1 zf-HC2 domain-containing protein [Leucobacter sp. M11]